MTSRIAVFFVPHAHAPPLRWIVKRAMRISDVEEGWKAVHPGCQTLKGDNDISPLLTVTY